MIKCTEASEGLGLARLGIGKAVLDEPLQEVGNWHAPEGFVPRLSGPKSGALGPSRAEGSLSNRSLARGTASAPEGECEVHAGGLFADGRSEYLLALPHGVACGIPAGAHHHKL